jgi:hypothetical protein
VALYAEADAGVGGTVRYADWCDIPQVDVVRSRLAQFAGTEAISAAFSSISSAFSPTFSPETPVDSSVVNGLSDT